MVTSVAVNFPMSSIDKKKLALFVRLSQMTRQLIEEPKTDDKPAASWIVLPTKKINQTNSKNCCSIALEMQKEIVREREVARGDKHHLGKSADRKAQNQSLS